MWAVIQPYLVKQSQVKALELFGVELHRQTRSFSCETLQLLDEVSALGQRYSSPSPTHFDAGLRWRLLTNRGNQAIIFDFWLEKWASWNKKRSQSVCYLMYKTKYITCTRELVLFLIPGINMILNFWVKVTNIFSLNFNLLVINMFYFNKVFLHLTKYNKLPKYSLNFLSL